MIFIREQWDRFAAVVATAAGGFLIVFGWAGVRDEIYPGQQIPFVISGGIGGLYILGIGAMLWISADLRDEWRKLDDIDSTLNRIESAATHSSVARDEPRVTLHSTPTERPQVAR